MKIIKAADGKSKLKISRKEWEITGKKAGWTKEAESSDLINSKNSLMDSIDRSTNERSKVTQDLFVIKNIAANEGNKELYDLATNAINEGHREDAAFSTKMKYIGQIYKIIGGDPNSL